MALLRDTCRSSDKVSVCISVAMTWLAWHLIRRISWDPVLGLKCSYVRPVYCQQCPESTQARETSHQIPKGSFGYLTADEFRGYPNVYVGIVRAGKLACMCNHSTLCFMHNGTQIIQVTTHDNRMKGQEQHQSVMCHVQHQSRGAVHNTDSRGLR